MPRVWVYPDREWANIGDVRWEVSTWIVRPESMDKDELDPDVDVIQKAWAFETEEQAKTCSEVVLEREDLAYGAATIQKQTVDWYVREDGVGEWVDVGESEELG